MHVGITSLTSGFLWSRWRGKRSRHSRRMHNPQCYVSGKMPMAPDNLTTQVSRASVGMMLSLFSRNIWYSTPQGLKATIAAILTIVMITLDTQARDPLWRYGMACKYLQSIFGDTRETIYMKPYCKLLINQRLWGFYLWDELTHCGQRCKSLVNIVLE